MQNFYKNILGREINDKKNAIWYSVGMISFSASSIFLLLVVTRMLGAIEAGVFSIGWAICQQMLTVGQFGTRNYQVADINQKYDFSYYLKLKSLTILIMIFGSLVYAKLIHLNEHKTIVALLLTILMSAEAFADVCVGFMQLHDRLELSGKSYFIRVLTYDLIFLLMLMTTKNLILAISGAIFFSYAWLLLVDYQFVRLLHKESESVQLRKIFELIVECFPIFFSAFLTNYIVNVPKNSIEMLLDDRAQSVYNVLFMPSAIITLIASFILVPMYTRVSLYWNQNKYEEFFKILMKMVFGLLLLTVFAVIAGYVIGTPILSIVFNLQLKDYRFEFAILLLAGGFNSLSTLFVYILTVSGRQRLLLYIYAIVAVLMSITNGWLVQHYALLGASLSYLFAVVSIVIVLSVMIFLIWKNKKSVKL